MPIIVDEVVISVEVAGRPPGAAAGSGTDAGAANQRREIVAECVERVLDILSQKEER